MKAKGVVLVLGLVLSFIFQSGVAFGQQLVYTPINPAFGGNPMNYDWLVNSAQLQNPYKDNSSGLDSFNTNPLEDFKQTLQRQILSELSTKLVENQLGNVNLNDKGTYDVGDYIISVNPSTSGISVDIMDKISGSKTNVSIPYL